MLLRYLENAYLKKATKTKQPNGTYIEELEDVEIYKIQTQELDDEISASVYGANVYKMLRIRSIKKDLESYLYARATNKTDNISLYYVFIGGRKYRVKAVNQKGIDLELV